MTAAYYLYSYHSYYLAAHLAYMTCKIKARLLPQVCRQINFYPFGQSGCWRPCSLVCVHNIHACTCAYSIYSDPVWNTCTLPYVVSTCREPDGMTPDFCQCDDVTFCQLQLVTVSFGCKSRCTCLWGFLVCKVNVWKQVRMWPGKIHTSAWKEAFMDKSLCPGIESIHHLNFIKQVVFQLWIIS